MLRLGCQVSTAGKIYSSFERAEKLGCNTMQIFARNPRQFRKTSLSQEDIRIFRDKAEKTKISPVVIHIPYTLNLATNKKKFYNITIKEFIHDFLETDSLGADYFITHMGSFKGSTEQEGLDRVAQALEEVLKNTQGCKTVILLENTSGSGRWLGYTFSHLRFVLEKLQWTERVAVCLDTAHAWAAGYEINSRPGIEAFLSEIEEEIGLGRIKVVHLNDTKEKLGSRHDRHFAIGQGNIGAPGFRLILNNPKLRGLPFILETPKESEEDDIKNLDTVRKLYNSRLPI